MAVFVQNSIKLKALIFYGIIIFSKLLFLCGCETVNTAADPAPVWMLEAAVRVAEAGGDNDDRVWIQVCEEGGSVYLSSEDEDFTPDTPYIRYMLPLGNAFMDAKKILGNVNVIRMSCPESMIIDRFELFVNRKQVFLREWAGGLEVGPGRQALYFTKAHLRSSVENPLPDGTARWPQSPEELEAYPHNPGLTYYNGSGRDYNEHRELERLLQSIVTQEFMKPESPVSWTNNSNGGWRLVLFSRDSSSLSLRMNLNPAECDGGSVYVNVPAYFSADFMPRPADETDYEIIETDSGKGLIRIAPGSKYSYVKKNAEMTISGSGEEFFSVKTVSSGDELVNVSIEDIESGKLRVGDFFRITQEEYNRIQLSAVIDSGEGEIRDSYMCGVFATPIIKLFVTPDYTSLDRQISLSIPLNQTVLKIINAAPGAYSAEFVNDEENKELNVEVKNANGYVLWSTRD